MGVSHFENVFFESIFAEVGYFPSEAILWEE